MCCKRWNGQFQIPGVYKSSKPFCSGTPTVCLLLSKVIFSPSTFPHWRLQGSLVKHRKLQPILQHGDNLRHSRLTAWTDRVVKVLSLCTAFKTSSSRLPTRWWNLFRKPWKSLFTCTDVFILSNRFRQFVIQKYRTMNYFSLIIFTE